jgi:hypothetical protein
MKCITFYCNIAHELKGTGMKTKIKHLSRLYDQVFVTYILQMFNEGTMSGPVDISVFNFSLHVVKQVEGNCSHSISYPSS